jgi:hypothetical protein
MHKGADIIQPKSWKSFATNAAVGNARTCILTDVNIKLLFHKKLNLFSSINSVQWDILLRLGGGEGVKKMAAEFLFPCQKSLVCLLEKKRLSQ